MAQVKLAPSILAADFTRLGEEVGEAIAAGAEHIHVDVMDGHFVPNLSIGVPVVRALRPITHEAGVTLDVHLMVEGPEPLIAAFAEAGADILSVHVEACRDLRRTVEQIRAAGVRPGVALNPPTPVESLEEILPFVDLALVMSVNPGFSGQKYIPASTAKIARLRGMLDAINSAAELEADGGVRAGNAREIVEAGASVLVAGTAIFSAQASISENMAALRRAAGE